MYPQCTYTLIVPIVAKQRFQSPVLKYFTHKTHWRIKDHPEYSPFGLCRSGSPQPMVIYTVIWRSFFGRVAFLSQTYNLCEVGLRHWASLPIEVEHLILRAGFKQGYLGWYRQMVGIKIQGYNQHSITARFVKIMLSPKSQIYIIILIISLLLWGAILCQYW